MIFVNFDHVIYFDTENSEFLQYCLSATVNAKTTWSDWKTQSISLLIRKMKLIGSSIWR